jgi:hypothetical protein
MHQPNTVTGTVFNIRKTVEQLGELRQEPIKLGPPQEPFPFS